ncbi:hypothetical protein GH714_034626 [Hevea brasiliensis]|uniref:Uncharacterized protein n=1 Tax=Hevea brasiliensis TaxID=3981 RepID=A0A6A6MJW4_HEVBR|nr:hypothetical protein GH714_034626 [Hevea brasiliensis]
MASTITDKFFFKGTKWEFSLNPGPFNMKEHVLITIFANSGDGNVHAIHIVSAIKIFYKKELTFIVAFLVVITTQVLGFGWAGVFRRYLVEPAAMWWPQNLVQVSLFRISKDCDQHVFLHIKWPRIETELPLCPLEEELISDCGGHEMAERNHRYLSGDGTDGKRFSAVPEKLVEERRMQARVPRVHVRNVKVGRVGSSVTGTMSATCSIGEFSFSSET